MDLPVDIRHLREVFNHAEADAQFTGIGFIRILKDGTVKRLPPSRVLYMPDDPEIPD